MIWKIIVIFFFYRFRYKKNLNFVHRSRISLIREINCEFRQSVEVKPRISPKVRKKSRTSSNDRRKKIMKFGNWSRISSVMKFSNFSLLFYHIGIKTIIMMMMIFCHQKSQRGLTLFDLSPSTIWMPEFLFQFILLKSKTFTINKVINKNVCFYFSLFFKLNARIFVKFILLKSKAFTIN